MITVSVCMIVKNEENNLRECVECLRGFYDELVIVDTGSYDTTKEVAKDLGAKVYEFTWKNDFAAARNFAFSKASCDYIYSADADERVDAANRVQMKMLKEVLDPEIDLVQMWYKGQLAHESVYNYDRELRPKLFKRVRSFVWEGAVHEQVRTQALVFDSDIEILHKPSSSHTARDLQYFRDMLSRGEEMTPRLYDMYARELCKAGTDEDFALARAFFAEASEDTTRSQDEVRQAFFVLARHARRTGDRESFFKYALRDLAVGATAEMCCELGSYFKQTGDIRESLMWYYNAAYEAEALLDIRCKGLIPFAELRDGYRALGDEAQAAVYEKAGKEWQTC